VVVALLVRGFIVAAYKIPTGSMTPTLQIGDCIFAYKLPYGLRLPFSQKSLITPKMPERGDIIVFKYPEDETLSFVKRVVGLPGDKIEIRQKRLLINDKAVAYGESQVEGESNSDRGLFVLQTEKLEGRSHQVMFRRGDDTDTWGPEVVPEGKFFVLGDNRDSSDDSRFWGMVPLDNIEGRAFFIWLSLDWERRGKTFNWPMVRWERLFSVIH
jgi:signal peptidase I